MSRRCQNHTEVERHCGRRDGRKPIPPGGCTDFLPPPSSPDPRRLTCNQQSHKGTKRIAEIPARRLMSFGWRNPGTQRPVENTQRLRPNSDRAYHCAGFDRVPGRSPSICLLGVKCESLNHCLLTYWYHQGVTAPINHVRVTTVGTLRDSFGSVVEIGPDLQVRLQGQRSVTRGRLLLLPG